MRIAMFHVLYSFTMIAMCTNMNTQKTSKHLEELCIIEQSVRINNIIYSTFMYNIVLSIFFYWFVLSDDEREKDKDRNGYPANVAVFMICGSWPDIPWYPAGYQITKNIETFKNMVDSIRIIITCPFHLHRSQHSKTTHHPSAGYNLNPVTHCVITRFKDMWNYLFMWFMLNASAGYSALWPLSSPNIQNPFHQ